MDVKLFLSWMQMFRDPRLMSFEFLIKVTLDAGVVGPTTQPRKMRRRFWLQRLEINNDGGESSI